MRFNKHPIEIINFKNHNQSHVVEASAGTGKTWTIERLFIKALLERQDLMLQNILVVTFTNSATRELKLRISEQIAKTIQIMFEMRDSNSIHFSSNDIFIKTFLLKRQDSFEKDLSVLSRSLQNFDHASIYTIHGFCNKIIRDYQIECGVNQPFKLVPDKSLLYEVGVRNFIREHIINNQKFHHIIDKVLANLDSLFNISYKDDLIQSILAKIPKDLVWIHNGSIMLRYQVLNNPDLSYLTQDLDTKENILNAKTNFLSAIAQYLANYYKNSQVISNTLSYDELIQIVADRVNLSASLRSLLNSEYPIAFIDEFQDTDFLQWQIFSNIYGIGADSINGSVVVVGDPKQAIYRFRGADIDVYLEAGKLIKSKLSLSENRRSHPEIMNFINCLFNTEINPNCFGPNIDYHEVKAMVDEDSLITIPEKKIVKQKCLDLGVVQDFYDERVQIVAIPGANASEKEENLLNSLALEILALLNSDPQLISKMAILVNKNREASILVRHLNKYGIRACELKIGNIFTTNTASELLLILEAIVDLSDRRLLIKAMATKIFNFPLNKLIDVNDEDKSLDIISQQFYVYKQIFEQDGIFSLIYKIIDNLSLLSEGSGISRRELSNLLQLAELINKHTKGLNDSIETLYWLKNKINNVLNNNIDGDLDSDNEEMVRLDNDEEQLVITTQHKAKGLEYDILFCPYFKRDAIKNSRFDPLYNMPFFAKYRNSSGLLVSQLVHDESLADEIVKRDNQEIHRLNYVAITRAKSRVYIYIKAPTFVARASQLKYHHSFLPDKIIELFGFVRNDTRFMGHKLFYYHELFNNPHRAIKQSELLPGITIYKRENILKSHLDKLKLTQIISEQKNRSLLTTVLTNTFELNFGASRQSYSRIVKFEHGISDDRIDDYVPDNRNIIIQAPITYRYSVLNELAGASFGVLLHNLCENYPIDSDKLENILQTNNVDLKYKNELISVVDEIFKYPLFNDGLQLSKIEKYLPELGFNLKVSFDIDLRDKLAKLLEKHYSKNHPYVNSARRLTQINSGFLNGFIDLLFLHNGKYYVLDYKTNSLDNYVSSNNPNQDVTNPLVLSNAKHHYYLQYLLYLVAVKRHLEQCLEISDATDLIGGALYYYIRGIFVDNAPQAGICFDGRCQGLVRELDLLLGSSYAK